MTDPFTPPSEQPPSSGPSPYGQPAAPKYGAARYGEPVGSTYGPAAGSRNGLGIAALVLGILAIPGAFAVIPGFVLGLLAVIFGVIGRKRVRRKEADNGGMARAGIITGAVGLVLSAAVLVAAIVILNTEEGQRFLDCQDRAVTAEQQDACAREFGRGLTGD